GLAGSQSAIGASNTQDLIAPARAADLAEVVAAAAARADRLAAGVQSAGAFAFPHGTTGAPRRLIQRIAAPRAARAEPFPVVGQWIITGRTAIHGLPLHLMGDNKRADGKRPDYSRQSRDRSGHGQAAAAQRRLSIDLPQGQPAENQFAARE